MRRREFLIGSAALATGALSPRIATPTRKGGSGGNNRIVELMRVPVEARDLNWLKSALQAAVELELSVLPPYLCAMWSIKSLAQPAYRLVQGVAIEEMLHMGLDCNLLAALGGTPQIVEAYRERITYPGNLPGGVRPELEVYLSGLSRDSLRLFMEIEHPEGEPVARGLGETYPSVGTFYNAILEAFQTLSPDINPDRQLVSPLIGLDKPVRTLEEAKTAITRIKEQGEGTSTSPLVKDFEGDFAHYYKFAEIYNGRRLIQVDGQWRYEGDEIPFPDVYEMSPIPPGGYQDPPDTVVDYLQRFNEKFATVLCKLESAWANTSAPDLQASVTAMRQMRPIATALMHIELPDGSVYGPDFRLPPKACSP